MIIIEKVSELDELSDGDLAVYLRDLVELVRGESTQDNFVDDMGGAIYLIESYDDLKKVYTSNESELPEEEQDPFCGGWASILEAPDVFDDCKTILDGDYTLMLLCTNNNGGNMFIVPKEYNIPNIKKSIEMTALAWGSDS